MVTINQKNAVKTACVGGCIYWIVIGLSIFTDLVTRANAKSGLFGMALILSTFTGVAFYSMIIWTMSRRVDDQNVPRSWSWSDAIIGFSPVPFIVFWVAVIIREAASN
jgi:glucan phosphoethanolaminetransferase (alkaline phosphatase superfamily)